MIKKREREEIGQTTIVMRDPDQEFTLIDDEVVMLSLNNGEYYALNSVASRIWEIIKEQKTVDEVTAILMDEFEVDQNTCIQETMECLNDFNSKSLLIVKENG